MATGNTTTDKGTPNENLDDYLKNLDETQKRNVSIPRSTTLNPDQVEIVIESFSTKNNLNRNQALVVISALFQSGGTSKGCDGNLTIEAFSKSFKLATLRKSLTDNKCKGKERKLARTLADEIYKISTHFGFEGNLTKKIKRIFPDKEINLSESYWLSDFQVDNPNCPEKLRNLILSSFEKKPKKS